METTTFLNLDWRTPITNRELILKLDAFWDSFDSGRKLSVQPINSTAQELVNKEVSGLPSDMILQRSRRTTKRYRGGRDHTAAKADLYVARMRLITEVASKAIDTSTICTKRYLWYKFKEYEISQLQVAQLFNDLALTIGVHPYAMGLAPESGQSFFRVPKGCQFQVEEVRNIFNFKESNVTHKASFRGGDFMAVAAMYKSIKFTGPSPGIRAVIICEHRSVKEKLNDHFDKPATEGIFLLMTGGFPGAACREFLHLLASHADLSDVPFLWMSDCDSHSLQMYSVLKYGSANLSYASPSLVCPQLRFEGLTMDQYENFARGYPQRFMESLQDSSPDQKEVARQMKKKFVDEKLLHIRSLVSSGPDKNDQKRALSLLQVGTLNLPGEERALAQLRTLASGGSRMSLIMLDDFDSAGIAFFFTETVALVRSEPLQYASMVVNPSQLETVQARSLDQVESPAVQEREEVDVDVDMFSAIM